MSQSLHLDAGTYSLSFLAAQRAGFSQQHYQEIQVLVDGAQVGLVTPTGTYYGSYETQNFTVTAGTHTIEFLGLNPTGGDNTAFVDEVAIAAQTDSITDGSFEAPTLAAGTYQYAATGSAWQFSAGAGVASNGSAFTSSNPAAPDGTQVAFLQGTGSMSQSVYLDAGTYSLSFLAAQREFRPATLPTVSGAGRRRPGRLDHALQHRLQLVPDAKLHGDGRDAHHRVPRREPGGRRQHGLRQRGGDRGTDRHDQRRQFRDARTGGGHLPVRAHRFGLAVLRGGRREQQ